MPNPVNCHIHLPANFSAFSTIGQAVELAAKEGVEILGASNYYDHRIYKEFGRQCREKGITPLYGIEIVCWNEDAFQKGQRINDPGNPGKMYLCGKALRKLNNPTVRAREILDQIRQSDDQRMDQMAGLLSHESSRAGLDLHITADSVKDKVAGRAGVPARAVTLQERHLAQALQELIFEHCPESERGDFLFRLLGAPLQSVSDANLVQAEIRSRLMKSGKPAFVPESFVSFDIARELILELDGIVAYPTVLDGMKPVSDFESSPETLIQNLRDLAIDWVEFIPNRNSPQALFEAVDALVAAGFKVSAGTEHNTTEMIPVTPRCSNGEPLPENCEEAFYLGAKRLADWQTCPDSLAVEEAKG